MFRVRATYRNGDHEIERTIEVDNLNELTTDERHKVFELATGAVTITEDENEEDTEEHSIGGLRVKVDMDTSQFEEKIDRVREILSAPLNEFVSVKVSSCDAEKA
ncbi:MULTISPECIES: hypothetical protein [unclassified Paenibacillus]|uniref:hypothetical protein n=1 Tax=unclassified Paenibacillus TaxID=185978 RepID=UPI0030F854DF